VSALSPEPVKIDRLDASGFVVGKCGEVE